MTDVKTHQLRDVLERFARLYGDAGEMERADALRKFAALFRQHDNKSVTDLASMRKPGVNRGRVRSTVGRR